jgi:hypothetical protein
VPQETVGKTVTINVNFDLGALPTLSKPLEFEVKR